MPGVQHWFFLNKVTGKMSILIAIANLAFLGFIFFLLYAQESSLKKIYWPALAIKLLAGILLGLLYTYYYSVADTFDFFNDGRKLSSLALEDFLHYLKFLWKGGEPEALQLHLTFTEPRALFMSKVVSVFCLLTYNNYWIISICFSFISFYCSWKFVNNIAQNFPRLRASSVFAFLFIPSVIFWGSGLMKESLSMASLFFLSNIILKLWTRQKVSIVKFLLSIFSVWILWQLKYYYAAIFIPAVATCLLIKFLITPVFEIKSTKAEITIWCALILLPFTLISLAKENFQPDVFLKVVVKNYEEFHNHSDPGDAIVFNNLQPTIGSILMHSPWALCSGLFRPFVWEAQNFFQLMISLENIFLLLLLITSIKNTKLIFTSQHRSLLLSLILYVVLLCIFLTLSTPNFGTLSRYRVGFLPFLFFLVSMHNPVIDYLYNSLERLYQRIMR
jgi:hypothetical protein